MKVKAAVHYEFHKPLVIEEVEIDAPGDNDALIKISATGITFTVSSGTIDSGTYMLYGIKSS